MISVIIPALNEESTIAHVVKLAKKSPKVTEVIVVDDKSLDNTIREARHMCKKFDVSVSDTLAVGDSENDIYLIKKSGIGISFCSSNRLPDAVADFIIKEPDFNLLIPIIQ